MEQIERIITFINLLDLPNRREVLLMTAARRGVANCGHGC